MVSKHDVPCTGRRPKVEIGGMCSLVGLGGLIGSGKDAVASYLVREHGYRRVGFADALKEEVIQNFPKLLALQAEYWHGDQIREGLATLQEAVGRLVWETKPPIVRALLQEYGSEVRRRDNPSYWTVRWARRYIDYGGGAVVVPDVRFPNEAEMLRVWGGALLYIDRPGQSRDQHVSEDGRDQIQWDSVLVNNGSLESLFEKVETVCRDLLFPVA